MQSGSLHWSGPDCRLVGAATTAKAGAAARRQTIAGKVLLLNSAAAASVKAAGSHPDIPPADPAQLLFPSDPPKSSVKSTSLTSSGIAPNGVQSEAPPRSSTARYCQWKEP